MNYNISDSCFIFMKGTLMLCIISNEIISENFNADFLTVVIVCA